LNQISGSHVKSTREFDEQIITAPAQVAHRHHISGEPRTHSLPRAVVICIVKLARVEIVAFVTAATSQLLAARDASVANKPTRIRAPYENGRSIMKKSLVLLAILATIPIQTGTTVVINPTPTHPTASQRTPCTVHCGPL